MGSYLEGVFPQKSIIKLGLRAKLISYIKSFVVDVLRLNSFWKKAREFSKGSLTTIPSDLDDFPKYKEELFQIKKNEDSTHKVIYCKSLNIS